MKTPLYVVEGHHDVAKLKLIDAHIATWMTQGSHFKDQKVDELVRLSNHYDVILLLDPDGAGERIRNRISQLFPEVRHIYVPSDLAQGPDGKVGIEHMKIDDLKHYLNHVKTKDVSRETWTMKDLFKLGLSGTKDAKSKRLKLAKKCNLPYANAKRFCQLLNQFNVLKEDILKKDIHES